MKVHPPDLRRAWTRWFWVIENLAERRSVRKHLTPMQYETLHEDLISACRLYETHSDPQVANTAREMALFVDMWISLDVLCGTEDKLIRDLVTEGNHKFGHRRRLPRLDYPRLLKLLKILIVAGLVTSAVLYWQNPDSLNAISNWSRGNWQSVLRFTRTSRKTFYLLIFLYGVVMACCLNSARRY